MQGKKHKYPPQWYKNNLLEPLNTWLKRAKCTLKSGFLGAKSRNLGLAKTRIGSKLERQSGTKCKWDAQNWTKKGTCQTQICGHLPVLRVVFALEGCCEQGAFCKNILSLRQFGIRWLCLKIPPIFQLPLLRQSLRGC